MEEMEIKADGYKKIEMKRGKSIIKIGDSNYKNELQYAIEVLQELMEDK